MAYAVAVTSTTSQRAPCGIARRATAPRASAPSPVGRPPTSVAVPYIRVHPCVSRIVVGKDGRYFITPREPREQIATLLLSISLSLSLSPLVSRMIGAVQKGGKSWRRRARNVAMAAIAGATVHVRRGCRRRPGAGVAREAYVCTTSKTMRTAKWRET